MPGCQGITPSAVPGAVAPAPHQCPHDTALGSPSSLSHSHTPSDPVPGMGQGDKRQGAIPAGTRSQSHGPGQPSRDTSEGLGQEGVWVQELAG